MANPQKDTIYIDVDDEITSIIEKLQNSPHRIVALVLPKRAAVLQSVVNMKLLKRSADQAKKHIVLITSESGLLPLAGAVGLYVASSLNSRPIIPPAPEGVNADSPDDDADDFDPDAVADQPIGRLAGAGAVGGTAAAGAAAGSAAQADSAARSSSTFAEPETIQLDNADTDTAAGTAGAGAGVAGAAAAKSAKKPRNNKLSVPNFNKFRLLLIGGAALLILLIGGFIYANTALSRAVVTLQTNSSDVETDATLNVDPSADQYDPASETLPAKIAEKQQVSTQQVSTSGQKNNGTRASGSVTLSLTDCSVDSVTVAAGTGISSGGKTFITQSAATMESVKVGGSCRNGDFKAVSTQAVSVTAQSAGADYNIAAGKFAVAGYSNVSGESGEPMTGGTDNIVKIVAQADIASATQKIAADKKDTNNIRDELTNKLADDDYKALTASLQAGDPKVTQSANVGDQADTLTVASTTTYTMYGVKDSDLKNVVLTNVKKQMDESKQKILRDGVAAAKFKIETPATSGPLQVGMTATSLIGPDIDEDKLIKQLAGKKTGEVKTIVQDIPGVSDATVKYSPFWVNKVPGNAAHVKLVIEKSSGSSNSSND